MYIMTISQVVSLWKRCSNLQIIGSPPNPDQDNDENIVGVFINKIIDPDNPFRASVC